MAALVALSGCTVKAAVISASIETTGNHVTITFFVFLLLVCRCIPKLIPANITLDLCVCFFRLLCHPVIVHRKLSSRPVTQVQHNLERRSASNLF